MRRPTWALLVSAVVVAGWATPAFAAKCTGPGPLYCNDVASGISGLALSSDRTTSAIAVGGYSWFSVDVLLTDANDSVTAVDVSCEQSKDGTNWSWVTVKVVDPSTGRSASKVFVDGLPMSSTVKKGQSNWKVRGQWMRCTLHGVGTVTPVSDVVTALIRVGA